MSSPRGEKEGRTYSKPREFNTAKSKSEQRKERPWGTPQSHAGKKPRRRRREGGREAKEKKEGGMNTGATADNTILVFETAILPVRVESSNRRE